MVNVLYSQQRAFTKRKFNPAVRSDLIEYKKFLQNHGWSGPCPFELEWPYTSIPYMIATKIAEYSVSKITV